MTDAHAPQRRTPAAVAAALALAVAANGCGGGGAPVAVQHGTLTLASAAPGWPQAGVIALATVARVGGADGEVSVSWSTADGTALAGRDYGARAGTLTWEDQDSAPKSIAVPLAAQGAASGPLAFAIDLGAATGGAALDASAHTAIPLDATWQAPAALPQVDLSRWKLNLPVDASGGTGGAGGIEFPAVTVLPAQLTAGYVDPYFYADAQGRIVFTAPANGAVTSPGVGIDHTRSELREVYSGPGADVNGDWTSAIGGTLTAHCVVRAVASQSGVATIGQVHGQTYVFMLLIYRPDSHDVAVDLYSSNAAASPHVRTPVATNVRLGDSIDYAIDYRGSTMTVTVNGHTLASPVDPSWAGTPMYFKLGAYHAAPSTGNAAWDVTQVAHGAFTVAH